MQLARVAMMAGFVMSFAEKTQIALCLSLYPCISV